MYIFILFYLLATQKEKKKKFFGKDAQRWVRAAVARADFPQAPGTRNQTGEQMNTRVSGTSKATPIKMISV